MRSEQPRSRLALSLALVSLALQAAAAQAPEVPLLEFPVVPDQAGDERVEVSFLGDSSSGCAPDWIPTFGGRAGTDGPLRAAVVHDDGAGPALYVVGSFASAGGVITRNVARWDGARWSALGDGVPGELYTIAVHDDGAGPMLYVGGALLPKGPLSGEVVRWNGSMWEDIGFGAGGRVDALLSVDDGSGRKLFVGGNFTRQPAPGVVSENVARWDGLNWSALPGANIPRVNCLWSIDTALGPAIVVGAATSISVGGTSSGSAAMWRAGAWIPLGGASLARTRDFAVWDDGTGAALYAAGTAHFSGDPGLLRLQDTAWRPMGAPGAYTGIALTALEAFDDGTGPRLFGAIGGSAVSEWRPATETWNLYAAGPIESAGIIEDLVPYVDTAGSPTLHVAGALDHPAGSGLSHIARVTSAGTLESFGGGGFSSPVELAVAYGHGAARRWVTPRRRANALGALSLFIDTWDGSAWSTLGEVDGTEITALVVEQEAGHEVLYVGGWFSGIDGTAAQRIARWDGATWSALGSGIVGIVTAIRLHDDGSGRRLYVGGSIASAGGVFVRNVAAWDGSAWHAVGAGFYGPGPIHALTVSSVGGEQALYAGGVITYSGGQAMSSVARWDGIQWSAVGAGLSNGGTMTAVHALAECDLGQGPELYSSGNFLGPTSSATFGFACWDGVTWRSVADAVVLGGSRRSLFTHDDGNGKALFVTGSTIASGGFEWRGIARWDGSRFTGLGRGVLGAVKSLGVFDDGSGRALWCAGDFVASAAGDAYVARWRGCPASIGRAYCAPAVPNSTGAGAMLEALGSTSTAEEAARLHASALPLESFGVFLASRSRGFSPAYNGSAGTLCLGAGVGLFDRPGEVQSSGRLGSLELDLDFGSIPTAQGPSVIAIGDTWHFQAWYRDVAPAGATSNFSAGLSITFE